METLLQNPVRFAKETAAGLLKYAFGKGIVSLAVVAIAAYLGPAFAAGWPVVAGFIGWKMYRLYDGYTSYKDKMINLYRDEIAQAVGCDPKAVTRQHLRLMARGDAVLGIDPNPVIAEALNRQRNVSLLSFCTAMLAAGATFALLTFGLDATNGVFAEFIQNNFDTSLKPEMLSRASVATISGVSGLVLHNGLDAVVGQTMGFFRATAHDRIALIEHQRSYGVKITPQLVFDVFLASNHELSRQVSQSFNKGLSVFTAQEKMQAMQAIGVADAMVALADQINNGTLKAGALAFELSSVINARKAYRYDVRQSEKSQAYALQQAQQTESTDAARATRFTDRHSPRSAQGSFVETEIARRQQAARDINAPAV